MQQLKISFLATTIIPTGAFQNVDKFIKLNLRLKVLRTPFGKGLLDKHQVPSKYRKSSFYTQAYLNWKNFLRMV